MSDYRWNAATRPAVPGDHVVGICKGGHNSAETPCEYQPITEADVLELMKAVAAAQAEAQELRDELARVRSIACAADRTVKAVIKRPPEHESLPLMARREWMFKGAQYAFRDRDSAWFQSVDKPGGIWEFCYRIADTDEHGLPVVERTADMPEGVTHMTLHTRRFFRAGELQARSVEGDEGLVRIEDYQPAADRYDDHYLDTDHIRGA